MKVEARVEQAEEEVANARTDAMDARARGVLAVLQARGFDVSDAVRSRIAAERDVQRLDLWLEKAIVATTIADFLDER